MGKFPIIFYEKFVTTACGIVGFPPYPPIKSGFRDHGKNTDIAHLSDLYLLNFFSAILSFKRSAFE
jgi:hypothetical protein